MLKHPTNGVEDGPIGTENYKRAVYRPTPTRFSIEMLPPTKISGSHNFGMRISSLVCGNRSSTSLATSSEYDIWRRWEDCLIFQGDIELEYRRMARSKRTRLLRGKGVRRDGFYKQDAASSWESLPPGPDPNSVARDISEYVPTLTKKGTVFRASQATIDQRAKELKAFIEALWKDDVPALIDELRDGHIVRDFFGFWRRDYEYAEKQRKQRVQNSASRSSVSSSIFSMYFSSSNPSVKSLQDCSDSTTHSRPSSTFRSPRQPRSNTESARIRKGSTSSSEGSPLPEGRQRAYSTSSDLSTSTPSDSSLDSPVHVNVPVPAIADDTSVISFDHNPQWNTRYSHERPTSTLFILPEEQEVCQKTHTSLHPPPISYKRRSGDPDRQGRIFFSPPDVPRSVGGEFLARDRSIRESCQTIDSVSCILEGLDYLMLPQERPRPESTSTMASFMTDVTVDGVLPREQKPLPTLPNSKYKSRIVSGPVSVSDFDQNWSDEDSDDVLDAFLTAESFPMPCFDVPHIEFPEVLVDPPEDYPISPGFSIDEQLTPSERLPAPGSATKSTTFSARTAIPDQLTIKVKYNDSLVLLRVPEEIPYKDLRQRVFSKLVGQEGIAIPDTFAITFLQPIFKGALASATSGSSRPPSLEAEDHVTYPVASAGDWENVAACVEGNKLTLLITDNPL